MTYAEINTKIQNLTGRSNTEFTNLILDWANFVQNRIVQMRNWWFLRAVQDVTLTDGTDEYSLPTDYKDDDLFYIIYNNDYYILELKGEQDLIRGSDDNSTGMPTIWYLKGTNKYVVRKIPDKDYTAKFCYFKKLADFTGTGDESNTITTDMPEILISGIMIEAYLYLQEQDRAVIESQRFAEFLKILKRRDIDRQLAREEVLVPTSGHLGYTFKSKEDGVF